MSDARRTLPPDVRVEATEGPIAEAIDGIGGFGGSQEPDCPLATLLLQLSTVLTLFLFRATPVGTRSFLCAGMGYPRLPLALSFEMPLSTPTLLPPPTVFVVDADAEAALLLSPAISESNRKVSGIEDAATAAAAATVSGADGEEYLL